MKMFECCPLIWNSGVCLTLNKCQPLGTKKKHNSKESVILQSLQNAVDLEHYSSAFWQRPLETNILSLNDIFRDISLLCKWWIFTWYVPLPENASPDGKHSAFDYDIMMLPCCVGESWSCRLELWFTEGWTEKVSMAWKLKKNKSPCVVHDMNFLKF